MKKRLVLCLLASFTLANSAINVVAQTPQLVPLTEFGSNGDGSIRPGDLPFITGDGSSQSQRGMAHNPVTDHLLIAHRAGPSIHLIEATNGAVVGTMPFDVLVDAGNTGFRLSKIGVADDGAVYVANLTSASTPVIGFVLYRYASETNEQTFVYAGDPSNGAATSAQPNGRWGDTMVVRGAGINTEILIASQGTLAAILRPTDATMTAFTATTLVTDASSGSMASGISFGAGNTFWTKANGFALRRLTYDLGLGTATTDLTFVSTEFPTRISPILDIVSSNLFVGIEVASGFDFVKLYDISNVSAVAPPVFLDRESYTTNLANNSAGQICHSDGRIWALNTEHGIRAFTLQVTNESVSPTFYATPVGGTTVVGSNLTLTARADGVPAEISYQWFFNITNLLAGETNTSLVLTNLQLTNSGQYSVVASNTVGTVTNTVTVNVVPDSIFHLHEPFNHPVGQLTGLTAPNGQVWLSSGTGDHAQVAPGNLDITGLATSTGNSMTIGGAGRAARVPLGSTVNFGSLFASFAVKINSLGATYAGNGLLASFANSAVTGGTEQQGRFLVRPDVGGVGYNIGVGKATSAGVFGSDIFLEGTTVFIVLRYTFVPGTANDEVSLWINPAANTFGAADAPAPTLNAVTTGTEQTQFDQWSYRQSTAANTPEEIQYDELRIANKWSLVTPQPATTVTLSITRSGNSIVLSWPTAGSEGFALESASVLANPTVWTEVTESIVVQGANNTVTLPISSNPAFYRLRK